MKLQLHSLVIFFYFCLLSLAHAADRYVDSGATGANNGTSWANAWTAIQGVTGVSAGDTIWVSGGPSGQTRTYNMPSTWWAPKEGTAGNPVTYKIGQDSAHNGTAIMNYTGGYWLTKFNNVVISGDAGDGQMHFKLSNYYNVIYADNGNNPSNTNVRISYVNFGDNGTGWRAFDMRGAVNVEIDHCYIRMISPTVDTIAFLVSSGTTWDNLRLHHNTFLAPTTGNGNGSDMLQMVGVGWSITDNIVDGYIMNYTAGQHQDGIQALGGDTYIKVGNNVFTNNANYAIYPSISYGNFRSWRIWNNVVRLTSSAMANTAPPAGIVCGVSGGYGGSAGYDDILIANNVVIDYAWHSSIALNNVTPNTQPQFTNCLIANNIIVNSGAINTTGNTTTTISNNVTLTSAQAAARFVGYSAYNAANDYHLVAAASNLIGQGINLTSYGITTDKDGNARPATGAWDLGPYQFSSGGGPPPNQSPDGTISAPSGNVTITQGDSVTFSGSGSDPDNNTPLTYLWNFGSGSGISNSTAQNPGAQVFNTPGVYTVTFTVTDSLGLADPTPVTRTITVTATPNAQISVSPAVLDHGFVDVGNVFNMSAVVSNSGSGGTLNGAASIPASSFTITSGGTYGPLSTGQGQTIFERYTPTVANSYEVATMTLTGGSGAQVLLIGRTPFTSPFDAWKGVTTSPMQVFGNYILQNTETTNPTAAGRAYFEFEIAVAGDYTITLSVEAVNTASDSVFIDIDAEPTAPLTIFDVLPLTPSGGGFQDRIVGWRGNGTYNDPQYPTKTWTLSAGKHSLYLWGREANLKITTVTLNLVSAENTTPAISVTPVGDIAFGSVINGQFSNLNRDISNTGGGTLNWTVDISGPQAAKFVLIGAATGNADSGENDPIQIRYTPTTYSASDSATLIVSAPGITSVTRTLTGTSPANIAPTITMTNTGGTFTAPADYVLAATATDSDGTITKVEFFDGVTEVAEDTTSPYSAPLTLAAGTYSYTAKATDSGGATTTSTPPVTVVVNAPVNTPPTVSITAPSGGASYVYPANAEITSTAADSDGTITKVEWFDNGVKIGEDLSSPYALTYSAPIVGSHSLTALATDNSANTTTSSVIAFTVTPVPPEIISVQVLP